MLSPMDRGAGFAMTFVVFQMTFIASVYFTCLPQPMIVSVPAAIFLLHHLKNEVKFFTSQLTKNKTD